MTNFWEGCDFTALIAFCFLIRDGKILLITRGKEPYRGTRTIPGGRKQRGESLREACVREMREETGLAVKTPRFAGILHVVQEGDAREYLSAYFTATDFDGELRASEEGALEWTRLETSANLPDIHPSCAALLPLVLEGRLPFDVTLRLDANGEGRYLY